jgi:hypothetical protein
MTAATLAVAMVGLSAVAWMVWPWLPIAPDAVGFQRLAMLALVVVIVVSFSPTMTAAVVADSGARGRLSDTVLAVVVLADLAILVLFSVSMLLARVVFDTGEGGGTETLAQLAWEIGGAVAFGVLIGVLFALYLRYIGRDIPLVLLAVCAVLSQVGTTQQLQPLLAALAAAWSLKRRSRRRTGRHAPCAPPVLVVFVAGLPSARRGGGHRSALPPSAVRPDSSGLAGQKSLAGFRSRSARMRTGWFQADCPSLLRRRHRVPGATSCSCCWLRRSRFTSSWDRFCFAAGWPGPANSTRTRPARSWSCPTANRTSTARMRAGA